MPKYRMIHVDHYMCKPVQPFDDQKSEVSGRPTIKVPIIRIFGADEGGNKICLHVHGFYPYVAIPNKEPNNPQHLKKIIQDIESTLKSTVESNRQKRNAETNNQIGEQPAQQQAAQDVEPNQDALDEQQDPDSILAARLHKDRPKLYNLSGDLRSPVHRVEMIESFNYYGYHHKTEDFFKLHLYNPKIVKQLAAIFEDCRVLGRFIPVFWAHLPYILLFFIDNNLRGMQFIEVDQLYWRKNKAPKTEAQMAYCNLLTDSSAQHLDEDDLFFEIEQYTTDIEATSTCELEADIRFEWILNKQRFGSKGNDDALRELWLDDQEHSQGTSVVDSKLPLYHLERCYIQQLCDCYEIDFENLNLELTKRPGEIGPSGSFPKSPIIFSDSDNSQDLRDNDDAADCFSTSSDETLRPSTSQTNVKQEQTEGEIKNNIEPKIMASLQSISPANLTRTSEVVSHEYQFLCLMSMELHISTRGKLRPDPAFDPIEAVFYCIRNDTPETSDKPAQVIGMIITDPYKQHNANPSSSNNIKSPSSRPSNRSFIQKIRTLLHRTGLSLDDMKLEVVDDELELIMTLVDTVKEHDPEILLGYEMEQLSWGYVLERSTFLNISVSAPLSRVIETNLANNSKGVEYHFVQPIMFSGRMVFSVWRIIRHDIHLNTCSYERIHHYALNERVPCFSFETLTKWFNENRNRWRVIDYYLIRVIGEMRILDKFDLVAKISELARVYGTQFIDVITRGSQIGIESMMLRLAKLQNLSPLSPTVLQRNKMKAPEALPLVMEPETNIYYDPVAVLDFQSLYPSVVIAYNYCYSTCLGRVTDLETKDWFNFGCSQLKIDEDELKRLLREDGIHVSPCGVAYVKKKIRCGVLPKMLYELITTRAMVKDQMKKNMKSERPNRRLQRILDHRQHGLKMMANTTYGYAGASYTGRMPCVEIADSIVSKGRETLENAIELVESRPEWGAKVVYGDTDSIFIQFKDCDKDTAFKRAYEMVSAISECNPYPIKMKFEKIYQPCVLQTKKRYCGFKYEFPEQVKPEFEAKGIETVRRDCCPAAAKMLEMALRIQFTTRDINQVKDYVQNQFIKIMSGKLSNMQDFIFARQYKPRDQDKSESVFVPAWQITKRLLTTDPRAEPRLNERVPFVIIYGEPKTPLVNLAKTPIEVLENLSYRINADYYIQKIICPTLNRIFCTLKQDTLLWYKSMPHQNILHRSHHLIAQMRQQSGKEANTKQSTMLEFFSPSHCPVCVKSIPLSDDICDDCHDNLQSSVIRLSEEITRNQRKLFAYHQLCKACSSLERISENNLEDDLHHNPCISYDCDNLFRYHQAKLDALNSIYLSQILKELN